MFAVLYRNDPPTETGRRFFCLQHCFFMKCVIK